jgi:hypothetical protein
MVFYPDGRDNGATIVSTADGQHVSNRDYKSELEAYRNEVAIAAIMRERSSVCG